MTSEDHPESASELMSPGSSASADLLQASYPLRADLFVVIPAGRDRIEVDWSRVETIARQAQSQAPGTPIDTAEVIALVLWLVRTQADTPLRVDTTRQDETGGIGGN